MMTTTMKLALGAALLAALPSIAQSQEIPANPKGPGEVVVNASGGFFRSGPKKHALTHFTRETGIEVVMAPGTNTELMTSIKIGQPEADRGGSGNLHSRGKWNLCLTLA